MSTASLSIMLMRHAEKDAAGDAPSLSTRGWQRAGALVRWLAPLETSAPPTPPLATPRRIVAAASSAAHPSTRPFDTVTPLAQALGVEVEQPFDSDDDVHRIASWLRTLDQNVLVCWRHDGLPALARALLPASRADTVPTLWPEDRFDLVWVLHPKAADWTLTQVPQQLLAGDRSNGIARRVASRARAAEAR